MLRLAMRAKIVQMALEMHQNAQVNDNDNKQNREITLVSMQY